jgi:hypothetical protein
MNDEDIIVYCRRTGMTLYKVAIEWFRFAGIPAA